jgi:hypothetical protein
MFVFLKILYIVTQLNLYEINDCINYIILNFKLQ